MKLWKNALKKFFHAINGIYIMIKEERSLVIHFIFLILVVALGLWLNITNTQWAIIILACALIIGLEIINTAVENLVDMISFKYNLKSRKIKDISSAAVFLSSVFAFIIGLIIFMPYIIRLVNQ